MTIIGKNKDKKSNNCILITGVAGFIGSHLAHSLLDEGYHILGVDSLSDYYSVDIKQTRLSSLKQKKGFIFLQHNVSDKEFLKGIFEDYSPDIVIHLAAQAGVVATHYRLTHYVESNIHGAENVIDICAHNAVPLLYASSSSVYGDCPNIPFKESEKDLIPKSFYAATKCYNEQQVDFYAKDFGLKAVGLRFFSIYGEDMRPDMAISKFTAAIYHDRPIILYGDNHTARDFTYIADLISIMKLIMQKMMNGEQQLAPIYNIGNQSPVTIIEVLGILENLLGKTTKIVHEPLRIGESQITFADTSLLYNDFGVTPTTSIEEGLKNYVEWFMENHVRLSY